MGVHARGNFTGIHIQPAARRRVLEGRTGGEGHETDAAAAPFKWTES